jgi:YVTN family beta-propeller protein
MNVHGSHLPIPLHRSLIHEVLCIAAGIALIAWAAAPAAGRDTLLVVVNRAPGTVSLYRTEATGLNLIKTLRVGQAPREVCISPDGTRAYVTNQGEASVSVVDLDAATIAATITNPEMKAPDGCTVSPDSKKLYVAASRKDSVFVIATDTNRILKEIPAKLHVLRRLTFSPDGTQLFLTCNQTPEIAIIDPKSDTVVQSIRVGNENRGGLAFMPDGKTMVAGSVEDDTVYFIDASTLQIKRIIGIPGSPQRIEITPSGHIFVLCRMGEKLPDQTYRPVLFGIFDPAKHDKSISLAVGQAPWGLAMTRDGKLLYVSSNDEDHIMVVDADTMKVLNKIPSEKDPNGIALRQ